MAEHDTLGSDGSVVITEVNRSARMSQFWKVEANNNWSYRNDDAKAFVADVLRKAIVRVNETIMCGDVYEEPITCDCEFPEVAATSAWHGNAKHTKAFALIQTFLAVNANTLRVHMMNVFIPETESDEICEFRWMRFCPITESELESHAALFEPHKV